LLCFFADNQFGFHKKYSKAIAILEMFDKILDVIANKYMTYSLGICIDLLKTFDTLEHNILLGKF